MIPMFDVDPTLLALYELDEWPVDTSRDEAMLRKLRQLYPQLDLTEEAMRWTTWMSEWREAHPRKRVQHRSRFSNWCQIAARRQKQNQSRVNHRPPGTIEEHGSSRLEHW